MAADTTAWSWANRDVGRPGVALVALMLLTLTGALLYALVIAWPPVAPAGTAAPASYQALLFGLPLTLDQDRGLFLVVGAAGALGAMVHSLRSFYWYVGNRQLKWSWILMYLALPVVGGVLAVIVYVVLRGGLIAAPSSSVAANPFGFAALAALVGLFSDQAIQKLQEVFNVLLSPAQTGQDHVSTAAVTGLSPGHGAPGILLTVVGSGLGQATAVVFAGAGSADLAGPATDAQVLVVVPPGAQTGSIAVITPSGSVASREPFTVDAAAGS